MFKMEFRQQCDRLTPQCWNGEGEEKGGGGEEITWTTLLAQTHKNYRIYS